MKTYLIIVLFLTASLLGVAQDLSHEYDSTMASQLGADDYGMKTYVLVILKTGPSDIQDKVLRDSLLKDTFPTWTGWPGKRS